MIIAISTAIPLLIAGVIMVWTAYRAYRRALPMNFWIGIRTTTTLRSVDAWSHGHAAAAVPIAIGGFGLIAAAATAVFVGEDYAIGAAAVGCAWIAIWLVIGSVVAGKAARQAENSPSD
ncbi:SdpI family protein [Microbacterium sp. 2216-1]|uniref:SdpI family protein n=1 Tax=Microbacterium sp. 2216-1 TaxID=3390053 RepID=UPI00397701DA